MSQETMTTEERVDAAMRCNVPDRVPCVPLIHYFAAACAGYTNADLWWSRKKYHRAMRVCYDMTGPWDAAFILDAASPLAYSTLLPMQLRVPGRDLPDDSPLQALEEEVMSRSDYDWMMRGRRRRDPINYTRLLLKLLFRVNPDIPRGWRGTARIGWDVLRQAHYYRQNSRIWNRLGVTMFYGMGLEAPFDTFSCVRSFEPFIHDIFDCPEKIREAADYSVESFAFLAKRGAQATGIKRFVILCHRTSNDFISPKHFKELALPSLKKICERLAEADILPILHCDGDWTRNLEHLLELPARKCCIQFDGRTDIFRAKEILKGHCCIYGDVPALMLYQAGPQEVEDYCKKLIKIVGKDGGYIMGSGCEVPTNAKPENVKMMSQSVRNYGFY
jgi:hypothetical protein